MKIDPSKRLSVEELEKSVSDYVSPFDFEFTIDQTVGEVLRKLHDTPSTVKRVEFFYITDREKRLQGVASLSDLLYVPEDTKLLDIIDPDVLKVNDTQPLEVALKILARHELLHIPVVDKQNHLKGVVELSPHESFSSKAKRLHYKSAKQDLFQFIGFSIEQRKLRSPWVEFRYRMPWLLCNLVGGFICALIGQFFQATLVKFVVLALLVPLVLTLAESIAIQSMTLSLRFLHFKNIDWREVLRRMNTEAKTSVLLGICSALLIAFFYFAWNTALFPIIAISISLVISMSFSALFGGIFPIILHALKLDPKLAAGPVILMVADIATVAIYYSLSTLMLL